MFEKSLADKMQRIFGVKKVTYQVPGEAAEQETLFIDIEDAKNTITAGKARAMVSGNALLFGPGEKIPFGFFSKRIAAADPADTKDLFFYDMEANTRRYLNLVQRGISFVYFFDSQHDPETGSITSVAISISEEP